MKNAQENTPSASEKSDSLETVSVTVRVPKDLHKEISDYRFNNRLNTFTQAMLDVARRGIQHTHATQ